MKTLRQYDAGVTLRLPVRDQDDAVVDLTGSETATVLLEAPSGHRKAFAATIDAGLDLVQYITTASDFDEFGVWKLQAKVLGPSYDVRSHVVLLEVQSNIDAPRLVLRPTPAAVNLYGPPVTRA